MTQDWNEFDDESLGPDERPSTLMRRGHRWTIGQPYSYLIRGWTFEVELHHDDDEEGNVDMTCRALRMGMELGVAIREHIDPDQDAFEDVEQDLILESEAQATNVLRNLHDEYERL